MSYILDGVNLNTEYGFYPGRHDNSSLGLAGFLDMPKRLGKCYHDWGAIHGVQPYTSANEIRFGGRDLSLVGFIMGSSKSDCAIKLNNLSKQIDGFTGAVDLVSNWGTQSVFVNAPVVGDYFSDTCLKVSIGFREPNPDISGTLPTDSGGVDGIDGISFEEMGGYLVSFGGDRRNRPQPKSFEVTQYEREIYKTTKQSETKLNLRIFMEQPNFAIFEQKIRGLYALFSKPGERNLIIEHDFYRRVFAIDGFEVSELYNYGSSFTGYVSIDLIQAGLIDGELVYIGDNEGNFIVDHNFDKILIF